MTAPDVQAARFFHGTVAVLAPGDRLVPGDEHGTSNWGRSAHVYATTTDFSISGVEGWGDAPDTEHNRLAFAIDQAEQWAAHAADRSCVDERHCDPSECACQMSEGDPCYCETTNEFHVESQREGMPPQCLRVYEIEPIGTIEADLSTDVDAGVRMPGARVIRLLTVFDKPLREED